MRVLIVTALLFTLAPSAFATPEASTLAPGGTPTAPACPSNEFVAVGALSISGGEVAWAACSPAEAYRGVVGASNDVVLIEESGPRGQYPHTIALDAANGSERWRRPVANAPMPSGPVDGMGIVVLATAARDTSALVGVDALTGDERWRVDTRDVPFAHTATMAVVWDWQTISNFGQGQFRAIDRVTGDELWVSDTLFSSQSSVFTGRSPAAVLGDIIVVPTRTTDTATVTAIDMQSGATRWTAPYLDHLHAADGVIIGVHGGQSPVVTAIDTVSGKELWTAPGHPSYGGFLAVGDGVVAVLDHSRSSVVAYDVSSGTERWRAELTIFAEPQMISGTSLVLLWEGEIAVLSTTDGAITWSATQPFQSSLMNNVGSNGDRVFVAINSLPWAD